MCPLKRAFAVLSFIKKFLSKLALGNRFVHPYATVTHSKKKPNFLILIGWRKLLLFVILRYKSDSFFNIMNVAIISYSTEIRRVSRLLFLSYAYLLLIEKRQNFLILIGLVCIANFLLYTPSWESLKLNCLVVKVILPVPPGTFSSYSNPESDFWT